MGQYYRPTIVGKDKKTVLKWMSSHEYDNGLKLMEHSYLLNKFVGAFESQLVDNIQRVVWAGDYADKERRPSKTNVHHRCEDVTKIHPRATIVKERYIINHTKKLFVDKTKVPDNDGWAIHPLPLLTCEGNGRGGGDYHGRRGMKLVGSWARHRISVSNKVPKGYKEIKFNLIEN